MLTDIQIAQQSDKKKIKDIAQKINLNEEDLELYGDLKAKIKLETIQQLKDKPNGKLVLVTSINPTPAGEGKSTVSVGLADALNRVGESTILALREPSLGPTMGIKGGAAGGGYAQVIPMEDINLHFTGDLHALTSANNALSAFIDNHVYQGNECNINPTTISWKRAVDLNDRALRNVVVGLGGRLNGVPREDGFDITVASELMAILCLTTGLQDLKERLKQIVVAETYDKQPVTVADLQVEGALALLLKDAIKPNLVQTLEHTPALVHGGPFANIAHGCNSVLATSTALKLADYTVTEAGFGADLGAEKFLDIKVPNLEKAPDVVVIVATIRALKMHGGVKIDQLEEENSEAITKGFENLEKHVENIKRYNLPIVVAINEFSKDTPAEINRLETLLNQRQIPFANTSVWANGSKGGVDLANKVISAANQIHEDFQPLHEPSSKVVDKVQKIVTEIYGGQEVYFTKKALSQMRLFERRGWDQLPICMAKTQYSLSDDPKKLGRPTDFAVTIREFIPKLGAGFIVALTGDVLTMPGLPKKPAALKMDIKENGDITGLF
ncbi:formate--tetrahydrofolate ligase [Desemzia sp. RIT804]|uniref:formate--tetrahydrofolate ligase n=1 Tax=Desemzia sp. RIT 804 TaxID=2810209 RepID=UPI00195164C5|nr:formate--tetrahydrofolate ligase [Desemzia sp. RIT 804]MBM6613746.1 formate--tetrahydrofolate ligase [Desemzia sp. RIT 804]